MASSGRVGPPPPDGAMLSRPLPNRRLTGALPGLHRYFWPDSPDNGVNFGPPSIARRPLHSPAARAKSAA